MIFVFGSNLAGRHGKGAALDAVKKHGAIYGCGVGLQGRAYAIPTKDEYLRTLPLGTIRYYVDCFLSHARTHLGVETYKVTRIGCGLAGYKDKDISPMFANAPANCELPEGWRSNVAFSGAPLAARPLQGLVGRSFSCLVWRIVADR